jgi:hypothetical protein
MEIEKYAFGSIKIDGETFVSDIIIFPEGVVPSWRRKSGHLVLPEDIEEIITYKPQTVIFGTGMFGVMKIHESALSLLKANNIETIIKPTSQAVKVFNKLSPKNKAVAALHLTC